MRAGEAATAAAAATAATRLVVVFIVERSRGAKIRWGERDGETATQSRVIYLTNEQRGASSLAYSSIDHVSQLDTVQYPRVAQSAGDEGLQGKAVLCAKMRSPSYSSYNAIVA